MGPTLNLYYDIQILMLLVVFAAGVFFVERDRRHRRGSVAHRFQALSKTAAVLCTLGFIFVVYGSFIEPRIIRVVRAEVGLTGRRPLSAPVRIALISDSHLGPFKRDRFMRRVAAELIRIKPDIVVLAGDLVEDATRTGEARYLLPLAEVARRIPVFVALGNHDSGLGDELDYLPLDEHEAEVAGALGEAGAVVLKNEHQVIEVGGVRVLIAGLADIRSGKTDPGAALSGAPPDIPRIVIAHNPDVVRLLDSREVDLLLAGHTHGGQFRLPGIGSLVRIPTTLGQDVDHGLFRIGGIPLYITSGIGESGARARLFIPPEIALITVR
ncbi:hypothetical protein A3F28_04235 [Candidatus Uhrbacteria bacterium RIFCSPHIGHO2_12_FULL_57_11]|uniref:Calcineurin-like phosphoesterase domain-containing protein n=1 Tax=Candidatus Uhrbacteria bacterium RIFCSPHIGHO2_12_FULL_57_11 TaxID=1802398 RepID=A0A1F7UJW0_9BACT|nr:MAG: hypothetical protein A3F28_04235 [Candidatus Uhrbacteria bacterium RIFCSPHIGHO2_12_FULL_57_11]